MVSAVPTPAYRALYNIAEVQMGYVTTVQAGTAGVSTEAMVMMERRGSLERVSRGVYRLVHFPAQPLAQYMQATLWPYGRRGVLSHETALSLHELSDVDPAKVHITVPADFRIQRAVPGYLAVHRSELSPDDVTRLGRMPITTPARTIRDCIRAHLEPALVTQAIAEARRVGMVDISTAAALDRELRASSSGMTDVATSP